LNNVSTPYASAAQGSSDSKEKTMDYEMLRAALGAAVPLVKHLGLEIIEVGPGRGVVKLPDRPELLNHVKSQHAAGLFAAAETASGAAMTGALADRLGGMTPLAKGAEITYKRVAKGVITATAQLSEETADIVRRIDADGKAEFEADVELTDEGANLVGTMTVLWHVSKRE
jgi:acyl-coenzyme A thioesterase PaaI-like protein